MNDKEKKVQENKNSETKKFSFAVWWKKLTTAAKAGLIAAVSLVVIVPIVLVFALGGNDNGGEPDGGNTETPNTETEKVAYTVTVVDEDGNGVNGVKVEFVMSEMPLTYTIEEEGKISFNTAKAVTGAIIKSIPNGYESDKVGKTLSFDGENSIKITLKKLPDFVIKVVDQDGNPIEGVTVQMCDEAGSCRMPRVTDENGEASYPYEAGTFHAQLTLSAGETVEELYPGYTVEDGSAYYDFDGSSVVIELTKIAE